MARITELSVGYIINSNFPFSIFENTYLQELLRQFDCDLEAQPRSVDVSDESQAGENVAYIVRNVVYDWGIDLKIGVSICENASRVDGCLRNLYMILDGSISRANALGCATLFTLGPNDTVQKFDLNSPAITVANFQHPANLLPPSPPVSEENGDRSATLATTYYHLRV
ncbi:hypothetical protein FOFC_20922 [Fusarium oxysporum]|nr:hypothetical protein FOFC_20922 [Fusarium oxysporum]